MQKDSKRLCVCKNIEDSQSSLDLYAGFMWKVIETDVQTSVLSKIEHEAKLMLQMMFTKVLHLKGILNGVSYSSNSGSYLNNIIDPGVVAVMSRNIFETGGLFNLIYRQPKTDNERDIIYNLCVPDPYYLDKKVKLVELFSYHKLGLTNKFTLLFGNS